MKNQKNSFFAKQKGSVIPQPQKPHFLNLRFKRFGVP